MTGQQHVRQSAASDAPIIASLDANADATVLGEDSTGPDGATRWVHVQAGNKQGYVRSDLVSEHHNGTVAVIAPTAMASPTQTPIRTATNTPSSVTSTTSLTALQSWISSYGYIISTIASDDDAVAQAAGDQSFPALLTACRRLAADIATAQSFPPIPDVDTATHLRLAYGYEGQSARDCISGVNNVDAASLQKAAAEIRLAANEMTLATALLRKAAGLS
ncbi:MAG: SH3 domain-containing protein [Thermomicrobiales bacterium]